MKWFLCSAFCFAGLLFSSAAFCLPPLQLYVEITPTGGVLIPPAGNYAGPVIINRPMTVDGKGQVTVDGEGFGTILKVTAEDTVVRGLHLTNSGDSHNQLNSGIQLETNSAVIENNVIDNVLFGINLKQADNNVIRGNRISSRPGDPTLRGEGIRLWNSNDNLIEDNEISQVRDMVFSNSADNRIIGNRISDSRMGMEFVFSPGNEVIGNTITNNYNGVVIIYSPDIVVSQNKLWRMRSITGSGISIKESSMIEITRNEIAHCAMGMVANAPIHPENVMKVSENLFAYNDIAMYFYGEKGGHTIHNNRFENNFVEVMGSAPTTVRGNDWRGNYWDGYEGFDLDENGTGDWPYSKYLYADRIWRDLPMSRFFRGSPALSLVDFIERLAPFSEPELVLTDPVPRIH